MAKLEVLEGYRNVFSIPNRELFKRLNSPGDIWNKYVLPFPAYGENEVSRMAEVLDGHPYILGDLPEGTFLIDLPDQRFLVMNPNSYYIICYNQRAEFASDRIFGVEINENFVQFSGNYHNATCSLRIGNRGNISASAEVPKRQDFFNSDDYILRQLSEGLAILRSYNVEKVYARNCRANWHVTQVVRALRGVYEFREDIPSKSGWRPFPPKVFGQATIRFGFESQIEDDEGGSTGPRGIDIDPVNRTISLGIPYARAALADIQLAGAIANRAYFESRDEDSTATLLVSPNASFNLEVRNTIR